MSTPAMLLRAALVLGTLIAGTALATIARAQTASQAVARAEATRPVLKREVTVIREIIQLGDLIDNAGAAAETPAFRAPAPGRAGTIQAARIVEAARQAGLAGIDPNGLVQVVVNRASRRIDRTDLEAAIRRKLSERFGVENADLTLTADIGEGIHLEPEATAPLTVGEFSYDTRSRRVDATLTVAGSNILSLKPIRVAAQVTEMVEVPVLIRPVAKGEPVRTSDIRLERRPRNDAPQATFADIATLSSVVARNTLSQGAPLRETDLMKPIVVERNSAVSVVYEMPGLSLVMRGKALEAGAVGDTVLVQNPQSKRNLQATVSGAGTVTVRQAMPGRVAEAAPTEIR